MAARIAKTAALAVAVIWGVKALVIWEAGGLDESRAEGPLFALGFLVCLFAFAALGVAFAAGHSLAVRLFAGIGGLLAGLAVVLLLDGAAEVLPDSSGWVQEEAGLWAAALVAVALAFAVLPRVRPARGA